MSISILRVGVIGSGGRGHIAGHAHKPEQGSAVVAVCDKNEQQFELDRQKFGNDIFCTTSYHELLQQNLDAVFVTVPDFLHEEIAVAALRACPAVYLEKPMAITTEGTDRILEASRETGSRLYLGHNMRHLPMVVRMKSLIDEGAIGEVKAVWCRHFVGNGGDYYFKDWHAERKNTTSMLLQKGSHDIDVMHWLAGSYSTLVTAMGGLTLYDKIENRQEFPPVKQGVDANRWPPLAQTQMAPHIDIEDISMVLMQLANGAFASYQECHYTPDYWRNYTVIGTQGRIENFGVAEPGACVKLWNKRSLGYNGAANHTYEIPLMSGDDHGGADSEIIAEFLRYAREGGKTKTSPLAARFSVATGVAAAHSLRNGSIPVAVAPLAPALQEYFGGQESR